MPRAARTCQFVAGGTFKLPRGAGTSRVDMNTRADSQFRIQPTGHGIIIRRNPIQRGEYIIIYQVRIYVDMGTRLSRTISSHWILGGVTMLCKTNGRATEEVPTKGRRQQTGAPARTTNPTLNDLLRSTPPVVYHTTGGVPYTTGGVSKL